MKIRVLCSNNQRMSKRTSVIDTQAEFGLSNSQWAAMSKEEKNKLVADWVEKKKWVQIWHEDME